MSEEDKSVVVLGEPIIREIKVISFIIKVLELRLGMFVRLAIHLECESNGISFSDRKEIVIGGDDYLAWGSDDDYVREFVKSKLASIL
jgi:hypothetical protein